MSLRYSPCLLFFLVASLPAQADSADEISVTARILDASGRPLPGAGVAWGQLRELTTHTAAKQPHARADRDGHVRFRIPRAALRLARVLVTAEGHASFLSWVDGPGRRRSMPGPERDLGNIRLEPGTTLRCRVVTSDGKPVSGARVTATDLRFLGRGDRFETRGMTGDDGVLALTGALDEPVTVVVEAPGHYTATRIGIRPHEPLEVTVTKSGFVTGRVQAPPSLIRDWRIHCQYELGETSYDPPRIGRSGRFRFTVERPGKFRVVTIDERQQAVGVSELLSGPEDGVAVPTPFLDQQPFVVRAADARTGDPISAIRVAVEWGDSVRYGGPWRLDGTRSRKDGAVRLCPPVGDKRGALFVAADGFAPFAQDYVWRPDEPNEITVDLVSESTIAGVVRERGSNAPIANVIVGIEQSNASVSYLLRTDERGRFRQGGLGSGQFTVVARTLDGTGSCPARQIALGGRDQQEVALELPAAVAIRGKIAGLGDATDYELRAGRATKRSPIRLPERATPVAADGSFSLDYRGDLPVDLWLVARDGARSQRLLPLGRVAEKPDRPLELAMPDQALGSVRGKIDTGALKVPRGGLLVSAAPAGERAAGRAGQVSRQPSEEVDDCYLRADGTYELRAAPGSVVVTVRDPVSRMVLASTECRVTGGKTTELDLDVRCAALDLRLPARNGHELQIEARPRPLKVPLLGQVESLRLYLVPGSVELTVASGWTFRGFARFRSGRGAPLAQKSVELEAGKVRALTLR